MPVSRTHGVYAMRHESLIPCTLCRTHMHMYEYIGGIQKDILWRRTVSFFLVRKCLVEGQFNSVFNIPRHFCSIHRYLSSLVAGSAFSRFLSRQTGDKISEVRGVICSAGHTDVFIISQSKTTLHHPHIVILLGTKISLSSPPTIECCSMEATSNQAMNKVITWNAN